MHRQKNFAVIMSGIAPRFDINKAKLAGIQTAMKVFPRKCVTVIPTRAGRLGREVVSAMPARWNRRTTFFRRAVGCY